MPAHARRHTIQTLHRNIQNITYMRLKPLILSAALWLCAAGCLCAQSRADSIRKKLSDPDDGSVLVVAHRGDWRNSCENSLEAIEGAIRMGVDIVEIDLRRTKDGHLVLMHDEKVDRTTTGKGYVKDLTLAQIKKLRLRDSSSAVTECTVPTLEEALLTAKGMVMLNLDKAFDYFDQVYGLLEKTGTTDLVIMKSGAPAAQVRKKYGKYLDKVVFMPIVDLDKHGAADSLRACLSQLEPVAVELLYSSDANPLPRKAKAMTAGKARIWYNTLWSTQAGGHDDDCSLKDPDKGYGYLIDSLGATMLQTDSPQYLIDYLDKRKH